MQHLLCTICFLGNITHFGLKTSLGNNHFCIAKICNANYFLEGLAGIAKGCGTPAACMLCLPSATKFAPAGNAWSQGTPRTGPRTGGRKQEAQPCAPTFSLHNKFPNLIYQKFRKTAISESPAMSCVEFFSSIPFWHFVITYLQAAFADFSFCLRCSWHS